MADGSDSPEGAPQGAPVRLNLGAGDVAIEGFTPVDRKLGTEVYPLDVPDGSVEEIRASHVLEHFPHAQVSAVVNHWVAKLRPGGRLRIAVPDFEWIARNYLDGEPINSQGYVMGGQVDANDFHMAIFDREALSEILANAGLERIGRWTSEEADCAALEVSLNLEGYKPTTADVRCDGVAAILSAPRFGPVMHMACAFRAFAQLDVPYVIGQGAYWHQVLAELMEAQIAAGAEWVLTLDYDTIFSAQDVRELVRLARTFPEADAICALQMKRAAAHPLLSMKDRAGNPYSKPWRADFGRSLVKIATGHFGCTLIRAARLKALPRPWFAPSPNAAGRWHDGKVDSDIAFWKAWEAQGFTLYTAPRVPVGHLAEVVLWPGESLEPIYQTAAQYHEDGVPPGVMGR